MAAPYQIYQPYEQLLSRFSEAAVNANVGTVGHLPSLSNCFKQAGNSIEVDLSIWLPNWGVRTDVGAGRRKDLVHIFMRVEETITRSAPLLLEKSTVHLWYFDVDGPQQELLHHIHFDYGHEMKRHPLCHAQLSNDQLALTEGAIGELEFDFAEKTDSRRPFKLGRVPTSDMSFSSALLCLAADHFGPFFDEFANEVKQISARLARPHHAQAVAARIASPADLRSLHWFPI